MSEDDKKDAHRASAVLKWCKEVTTFRVDERRKVYHRIKLQIALSKGQ